MSVVIDGSSGITTNSGTVVSTTDATLNGLTVGKGGGSVSTNTAVGASALNTNSTGGNNTGVGYQALYTNQTGIENTAVGQGALYSNTASNNTAVGRFALNGNTTGTGNSALGQTALYPNSTGSYNTAIGQSALFSNTTASYNTAVGYQSGYTNVKGSANAFFGYQAGYLSAPASALNAYNTFIGCQAGYNITTGIKNTIIGTYNGNQGGVDIRTQSNFIVLSDGDGNPRAYWNQNGTFVTTASINNDLAGYFKNGGNSTPYGIVVQFTAADPNNTSQYFFQATGNGTERLTIRANGGIANYSANNVNLSDQRTKKDIKDAGNYLNKICAIPVRTFLYKDQTDDELNLGVIAQEVEAVAPELIDVSGFGETAEDGIPLKAIYQTDLQYALMKSIQELKVLVDAQATEIAELKTKVGV